MDPARWPRLRPLLEQALDLDGEAREAFVAGVDVALRAELLELLHAHASAPPLHSPASALAREALSLDAAAQSPREDAARVGACIGGYRLLRLLGAGGMGAVYLAEREEGGFRQRVALKLIRSGAHGGSERARFAHERQILAQLRHPNIATLLDGGEADDGSPWFTLEYVDGEPITEHCRQRGLGVAARIGLLVRVGAALAYAHRNLVVHRDIKPSNVLVDHEGRVKLLDFGIAKLLGDAPGAGLTQARGAGPMTPEYAAPEQFRGGRITAATDVYQFGVLMFRLLSGRLPYRADAHDALAWAHAVTAEEPLRLAQALDARTDTGSGRRERLVDSVESGEFRRLRRALRGDLEAIVRKALAKQPDDRYASIDAMVADLDAVLDGRPVAARQPSAAYHLSRFVQRHRWAVAASSLLLAGLLAAVAIAIDRARVADAAARQALAQAARAQREAERARAMQAFVGELFQVDDPGINRGEQLSAAAMLENGARRLAGEAFPDLTLRAELEILLGRTWLSLGETRKAHARFEAAIAALRRVPGAEPALLARALERAALAASRTAQAPLAEEHLAEALALAVPVSAASVEYHLDLAATRWWLLRDGGHHEKAHVIAQEALELARRWEPASGSERVVAAMGRLGTILADLGRDAEAEGILRESAELAERLFGAADLRAVMARQTLGWLYTQMGRLDAAAEILEAARVRLKALVGERSARYAGNAHNRGLLYARRGEFVRALAAFEEAARITGEVSGPDSLERGWALTNVGWTQVRLGRDADALATFALEARCWQANLADDSPVWAAHDYAMARAALGSGALAQAAQSSERSVQRYRRLGAEHRSGLLRSLLLQAEILRRSGDAAGAAALDAELATILAAAPALAADLDEQRADLARLAGRAPP